MLLYLKMAWRNIFRNKRRTLIAGTAIGIGLASLIFTDALIRGMEYNMIRSATSSFLGEAQIHASGFRDTYEPELTIHNLDSLTAELDNEQIVKHYSLRVMSQGTISAPTNIRGALVVGIDPLTERYISEIDDVIVAGDYFAGESERQAVLGSRLSELLEIELGDRIVLTTSQVGTGELVQEMFRVTGIFHFDVSELDEATVFIPISKARSMLNLPGQAHEIALKFITPNVSRDKSLPFWSTYSRWDNEAVGWPVLMPQLMAAMELSSFSTYLVGLVLFSVVALGIINTLFMSLYERMFEFGVLRAVGTRPFVLGRLIVFEAACLALVSVVMGAVAGFAVSYIMTKIGINYSGIEFAGVTFRKLLYPIMTVRQYIEFPLLVFVFTILIGLYPATHAAKMRAAEAMRKSI